MGLILTAETTLAQQSLNVFDNNAFTGYINTPTVSGDGTLILRNTNPRPVGSQAYSTGVGTVAMPAYNAGDTLQWAILARTTTGGSAPLNIGVQNGSGDVNNLSVGQVDLPTLQVSSEFQWILTSPVQVSAFKNRAYFWIPVALGQEIQIKQIVLGDPGSIQSHLKPVSWWTANGDAKDSVDGNAGALQNNASLAAGKIGNAFSFTGGADHIQVGNRLSLKMTDKVSVEAWIYPTGNGTGGSGGGIIINKEGEYEIARFGDGTIRWAFANSQITWTWIDTGFVAPLNQWTHVAVSYGDGSVRTFANGALVHTRNYSDSSTLGDVHVGEDDFRIGGRTRPSSSAQNFQGLIDEVKVYNRTRSASEIQSSFASAGNYTANGLVGNPDFETDSAIGKPDSPFARSFGNFVGNQAASAKLGQSPVTQPNSTGSRSGAVQTNAGGSGGYFYQDFAVSSQDSYEWTFWIRPEQGLQQADLIWDWTRGGTANLGTFFTFTPGGSSVRAYNTSNLALPALSYGQWHKISVRANAGTLTQEIYFDDALVGTTPAGTALPPSTNATMLAGKFQTLSSDNTQFYYDDFSLVMDTTAPVLSLGDVTAEATSASGASVNYTATASDDFDGETTVDCSPASGSTFALGTTAVNCSATDASGNSSSGQFTVTVQDTINPTVTIVAPAATGYVLNQSVLANYSCADSGSGVASCEGTASNNSAIDTATVGTKTFAVTATDAKHLAKSNAVFRTDSFQDFK
ncbi:MAG TPA: LamG-like jellyroll fold domain-containing protein [Pyrinomonadaceae bacterium]|nr:LamG-like jellyroll fold domain-containing protein [Pyrinomonadaceae bacterium]